VGRALLSRSAESRDWADTGDPDYEPVLEGGSAGPDDGQDAASHGQADAPAEDWRSLPDVDTVMLARPEFPAAPPASPAGRDLAEPEVRAQALPGQVLPPRDPAETDRTAPDRTAPDRAGPDRAAPDRAEPDRTAPDRAEPDSAEPDAAARASARKRLADQVAANAELAAVLSERDAAAEAAAKEAELAARPPRDRRPRRQPVLLQGLFPALVAVGLMLASSLGVVPLAVAVLALQITLLLGALALLDAPAAGGAFLVAAGAVLAGDAVVLLDDGSISGLAGVVGLGFVGALGHQLARRGRSRVTESLADTLVVTVFGVAASCLIALHAVDGGQEVLLVSLAAAGAVLLAGRIGDRLAPQPVLAVGSTRGWPGLLLGLGAGVAAAASVASLAGEPPLRSAFLLGLVVASTVATADLAVDLGAAELRRGWRDARRVAALRPTGLLLPYAVLGPVALLAGRLLLS
jgi:hypothetical protein